MGKRYHCEYCDKTMVAAPAIVKTHNKGFQHQKLVQDHYNQFKGPEQILAEEEVKKPCSRYLSGACNFGSTCRFSHYTQEQLEFLRNYVASKNQPSTHQSSLSFEDLYRKLQDEKSSKYQSDNQNTALCDSNGMTHILPWTYNPDLDSYGENLPPSLKRIRIENFLEMKITEWG